MEQDVTTLKDYPLAQLFHWRRPLFMSRDHEDGGTETALIRAAVMKQAFLDGASDDELLDIL